MSSPKNNSRKHNKVYSLDYHYENDSNNPNYEKWDGYVKPNEEIDINTYKNKIIMMKPGDELTFEIHHPFYRKQLHYMCIILGYKSKSFINKSLHLDNDSSFIKHLYCGNFTQYNEFIFYDVENELVNTQYATYSALCNKCGVNIHVGEDCDYHDEYDLNDSFLNDDLDTHRHCNIKIHGKNSIKIKASKNITNYQMLMSSIKTQHKTLGKRLYLNNGCERYVQRKKYHNNKCTLVYYGKINPYSYEFLSLFNNVQRDFYINETRDMYFQCQDIDLIPTNLIVSKKTLKIYNHFMSTKIYSNARLGKYQLHKNVDIFNEKLKNITVGEFFEITVHQKYYRDQIEELCYKLGLKCDISKNLTIKPNCDSIILHHFYCKGRTPFNEVKWKLYYNVKINEYECCGTCKHCNKLLITNYLYPSESNKVNYKHGYMYMYEDNTMTISHDYDTIIKSYFVKYMLNKKRFTSFDYKDTYDKFSCNLNELSNKLLIYAKSLYETHLNHINVDLDKIKYIYDKTDKFCVLNMRNDEKIYLTENKFKMLFDKIEKYQSVSHLKPHEIFDDKEDIYSSFYDKLFLTYDKYKLVTSCEKLLEFCYSNKIK